MEQWPVHPLFISLCWYLPCPPCWSSGLYTPYTFHCVGISHVLPAGAVACTPLIHFTVLVSPMSSLLEQWPVHPLFISLGWYLPCPPCWSSGLYTPYTFHCVGISHVLPAGAGTLGHWDCSCGELI